MSFLIVPECYNIINYYNIPHYKEKSFLCRWRPVEVLTYITVEKYRLHCQKTKGKLTSGTRIHQEPGKNCSGSSYRSKTLKSHPSLAQKQLPKLWSHTSSSSPCSGKLCQYGTVEPGALGNRSQNELPQRLDLRDRVSNTEGSGPLSPGRTYSRPAVLLSIPALPQNSLGESISRNSEIEQQRENFPVEHVSQ